MKIDNKTPLIIAVSVIVAVVSLSVFYFSTQPSQTDPAITAPVVVTEVTKPAGEEEPASATEVAAVQTPEPEQPPLPETEAEAVAEVTQGINLARVRPDGSAVIAGVAMPGSTINLMIGDRIIGSTVATDKGEWVVVPDELLDPGSHLITVTVIAPDGTTTVEAMALVIEIPQNGEDTPLVALVPYAVEEAPVVVLQAPDTTEPPEPAADVAEIKALAPLVTIRSVQAFNPGYLSVGGRAEGGAEVLLSVNDQGPARQAVNASGRYQLGQPFDAGADQANLTVSLLDDAGKTLATARLALNRGQLDTTLSSNTLVVVQKGDALWRIAYQTYGKGIRYVDIYRENSSIIRDPDLIYPDQIFVVPNS